MLQIGSHSQSDLYAKHHLLNSYEALLSEHIKLAVKEREKYIYILLRIHLV